jgi:hypothetical protein
MSSGVSSSGPLGMPARTRPGVPQISSAGASPPLSTTPSRREVWRGGLFTAPFRLGVGHQMSSRSEGPFGAPSGIGS